MRWLGKSLCSSPTMYFSLRTSYSVTGSMSLVLNFMCVPPLALMAASPSRRIAPAPRAMLTVALKISPRELSTELSADDVLGTGIDMRAILQCGRSRAHGHRLPALDTLDDA